jgi:hypothetical protein
VRDQAHPGAGQVDVLRDVGVAGHDAGGRPGARRQVGGGDLAGVQRVHAEAEAEAEGVRGPGRDLGGLMGEVAVQPVDHRVPRSSTRAAACRAGSTSGSIRSSGRTSSAPGWGVSPSPGLVA